MKHMSMKDLTGRTQFYQADSFEGLVEEMRNQFPRRAQRHPLLVKTSADSRVVRRSEVVLRGKIRIGPT